MGQPEDEGPEQREPVASRSGRVGRRIAANALDMGVVMAWAVVAALVGLALRTVGLGFAAPTGWDLLAFAALVLPVVVTFAVMEAGPAGGTFGKRRLGMVVVDAKLQCIGLGRSLLRSGTKFAPWQVAHTGVFQLAAGEEDMVWIALAVIAQLVVLVSIVMMSLSTEHRALHDWIAGTRVVSHTLATA